MTWGYLTMHGISLLLNFAAAGISIWIIQQYGEGIVIPILAVITLKMISGVFGNKASYFRQ